MRSPDPTDTGLDLDLAGTADDLVALVQRAVTASGQDAQTTRHYVAIDGGTSADIRLRVVSVDDPAPLLAFAITTAPSARGVAAATFILQHGVQKRRRQRTLLGQEPFLSFLRTLAGLVADTDPGASATVRVHGTRTVLAPRPTEDAGGVVPTPGVDTERPTAVDAPAPGRWTPAIPDAPSAAPETSPDAATPTSIDWTAAAAPTPPAPPAAVEPHLDTPTPERLATPASGTPVPDASVPPSSSASPASSAVPAASSAAPAPAPEGPHPVVAPPAPAPQFREPAATSAQQHNPSSSVPPELQITVPPGLIAGAPMTPPRPEQVGSTAAPARPAGDVVAPRLQPDLYATVVSAALRAGDFALELPDGERIALHGPLLLGRNPSPRPEQPDAELRPVVDPRMSVSKTHTVVVPGRRSLRVTDLHSTNGTTITDASGAVTVCLPGQTYVAEAGSTIGIGEFPIRVVVG